MISESPHIHRVCRTVYCFLALTLPYFCTAQCTPTCNNQVNISLDADGLAALTPDMILEGTSATCTGNFTIQITDIQSNNLGDVATCDYIDQLLAVKVIHNNSGNFCWGSILIEDKMAPTLTCLNDTIFCNVLSNPVNINAVIADDNCDLEPQLNYYESTLNQMCNGDPFNAIITRTWTAMDASGNQSASCTQDIYIRSASLADVVFPPHFNGTDTTIFDCNALYPTPEITGEPMVFGDTIAPMCKLNTSYADLVLDICENSYKIRREWTVLNCCTNELLTDYQWIHVLDTLAPVIICPDTLFVGTNESNCAATVVFPTVFLQDDCSNSSVTISSPFGEIAGNGGLLFGVPMGTHHFTITASDACANDTTCTVVVIVEDNSAPIAICDELTTVSITTNSVAVVNAESFDDGSYDLCCAIDSFRVRRMDMLTGFDPSVTFTCDDVGEEIMVVLRVFDCEGNFNECMITVEVQDFMPPSIICPDNISLDCGAYTDDPAILGFPVTDDNCTVENTDYQDIIDITPCNIGTITRTWTVTDEQGLMASCVQVITFEDTSTPMVTFPENDTLACTISPDMAMAGEPILEDNCSQLAVAFSDEVFPISCGFKIHRTWQVMDWCSDFTASDLQIIIILDNQAPVFDQAVGSLDIFENCSEAVTNIPVPTASDLCSTPSITLLSDLTVENNCLNNYIREITYEASDDCGNVSAPYVIRLTVEDTDAPIFVSCPNDVEEIEVGTCERFVLIDLPVAQDNCGGAPILSNNSPFALTNTGNASGTYPLGETIVTYYATDACGNVDSCSISVLITDESGPSMNCISPLAVYLQDTIQPILISDINNNSSDACSNPISLGLDINKVDCEDVGFPVTITLTGTDQVGNSNFCTSTLLVLDTAAICDNEIIQPAITAGTLRTTTGTFLEDIMVYMDMNGEQTSTFSDENGVYYFEHDYTISPCLLSPYKNDDLLNSVTTYDMVLISRHILSTQPIEDSYLQIAADVNNTGSITTADVVALRRAILGLETSFPNNSSWRFIPIDFPLSDTPLEDDFPEEIWVENPSFAWTEGHFIAIKIGDINGQ